MTTETQIDLKTYEDEYKSRITKLIEEYDNPSDIPRDEQFHASEKLRAAYSVHANPGVPIAQVLKQYAIDHRVWSYFTNEKSDEKSYKRLSRAEKLDSVLKWASCNIGKQVTLQTLIEESDIAYSMAKKITEDRPDVFRKVKRGIFEIRDPKADRDADKSKDKESSEK
jgi:hypothetical protein